MINIIVYIEEASNVDESIFVQLQARLRNTSAIVYDEQGNEVKSLFMGLICSNPDDCWIRTEFILKAEKIFTSASIERDVYDAMRTEPILGYHAFISSTRDNDSLPLAFVRSLMQGKTQAWIDKFIDCKLGIKEGAVYPEFSSHIVEPFKIPDEWGRIYAFDKGYRDETALLCGAISPTGTIYIYDEYYVSQQPLSYHADHIKPMIKGRLLFPVQADPSVRNKNDQTGVTYQSYFYSRSGIMLEPANNAIVDGIDKVRDYMYRHKLKIFSNCVHLKDEASKYAYPKIKETSSNTATKNDIPIDRYNHLMDCLRYILSPLPDNPDEFNSVITLTQGLGNVRDIEEFEDNNTGVIGGKKIWKKSNQQVMRRTLNY